MNQEKILFPTQNNLTLCGILDEVNSPKDKNKIVIMIHGNGSSKDGETIKGLASQINERNINTFRIDLNGCGESEGTFAEQTLTKTVQDIESAIKTAKKLGYTTINLFGHSAGGNSVLSYLTSNNNVSRAGLLAPVSNYPKQRLKKYGPEGIEKWRIQGYIEHNCGNDKVIIQNYLFYTDSFLHVINKNAKNISCPVMIVHGTNDEKVDVEDSKNIIQYIKKGKLYILSDGDHYGAVDGSKDKMRTILADWFNR